VNKNGGELLLERIMSAHDTWLIAVGWCVQLVGRHGWRRLR